MSAASLMDFTIVINSSIFNPSSIIKANDKYFGMAPHMATSLTVPCTANSPILPPLKNIGDTTKLSVDMAIGLLNLTIEPSCF